MAHLIRLQEISIIVTEFAAARAQKPKAYKQRITTKNLYGNKRSATGPEKKQKTARDQACRIPSGDKGKVARNKERNQIKALKVAREVSKGAEVMMKALELYGNPKLNSFNLPDLVALPTNADPQGNEAKPKNKSGAMLRVRALSSVQAALSRCALAIAIGDPMRAQASAPAPSLAPSPAILSPRQSPLPLEEDIEVLRLSFCSVGLSGVARLSSVAVGSDAE